MCRLAKNLKLSAWYELYRYFSADVHAQMNTVSGGLKTPNGQYAIQPVRYPADLNSKVVMALSLAASAFQTIVETDFPDRRNEYLDWYAYQISPGFNSIVHTNITTRFGQQG